ITATWATWGSQKVTSSDDVTLQIISKDKAKEAVNTRVAFKGFNYPYANTLAIDQVAQAGSTGAVLGVPSGADAQQALMNGISTRDRKSVVEGQSVGPVGVHDAIKKKSQTAVLNVQVVVYLARC